MTAAVEIRVAAGTKQPIHFGGGHELFGLYHPPAGAMRDAAILLVCPLGTDYTRSDRAHRHLAERLAAMGFPVLRYDHYGTGDSGGDEHAPELVRAWLDDVGIAAAELRARSGLAKIALIGLRIGATFATAH